MIARGRATLLVVLLIVGVTARAQEANPVLDDALARLDSLTVLDHSVVRELVSLGPSVLPDVIERLHSDGRRTALAAGMVVGELGDETTVSPLLEEWAAARWDERYTGAATALMKIVRRGSVRREDADADSTNYVAGDLLESVFCAGPWAERLQSGEGAPVLEVSVGFLSSRESRYFRCGAGFLGAPSLVPTPEDSIRADRVTFDSRVMFLEAGHEELPAWAEVMGQAPSELALVTVTRRLDSEYPGDSALWARCSGQWSFMQVVEEMVPLEWHSEPSN